MRPAPGKMPETEVFAPAKVNLTLHVTGQRPDGYHLLDSLVAFAPVGDVLRVAPGQGLSLHITGPMAGGVPGDGSNLVMKAAALLAGTAPGTRGASLRLDKHLPPASGIGGGSSDAAAAIRGLALLWGDDLPPGLARLGADVPMCLMPHPQRVGGIGDVLEPVTLPPLPAILVNPRVEVPTSAVFRGLARKDNPPMPKAIPAFAGASDCIDWLVTQRNDLQAPAIAAAPVIAEVLGALTALPGCRLARMSGSGATCFALFATETEAGAASAALSARHPDWWVAAGALGDQSDRSRPRMAPDLSTA